MDDHLGNLVAMWALDNPGTAFLIMWALGVAAGGLLWGFSKRWHRVWRVLLTSFGAAIFLAPCLAVGHGHGLAVLPGLLALPSHAEDWGLFLGFFGSTWLVCMVVCTIVSFVSKRPKS